MHDQLDDPPAVVEEGVTLDADLDVVWHSVTDAEELGHWLGADVELDVRVGGRGTLVDDDGVRRDVEIVEVAPADHRISWRWRRELDGAAAPWTTVEIELAPRPDGTEVRVRERAGATVPHASVRAGSATAGPLASLAGSARAWRGRLLGLELVHLRVPLCIAVG